MSSYTGKNIDENQMPDVIFGEGHLPEREWNAIEDFDFAFDLYHRRSTADRRSLSTTSSYSQGCTISKEPPGPPKLHRLLTLNDIEELSDFFSSKEGKLKPIELKKALETYKIYFTEEDFQTLFLKINTDRDQLASWDEFVTYLILGFEDDEGDKDKEELDVPIKEYPVIKRTRHRHPIARIDYFPTVLSDRSVSVSQGSYVVAAIDGTVNYFTLDWDLQRFGESKSPILKVASTYVTDCICLPDIMIVCIASTERDLRFYDTSANKHALRLHLVGLPEIISTMHYHFDKDINVPNKLLVGDNVGSVHLFEFLAEGRGPFRSNSGGAVTTCHFSRVKNNETLFIYQEFFKLHPDKVKQVEYCPSLNKIISAAEVWSSDPLAGFHLIDLGVKGGTISFSISKGVTCFCFDPASNILATGGSDWILRLWSPFTPEKPYCILPGHHAGICYIFIQDNGKKVYSLDKEKVMIVNLLHFY